LDLKLPVQAVSITTKGVSKKLLHVQVYSIQQYVIPTGYSASSINKTDLHDLVEILLKVALIPINQSKANLQAQYFVKSLLYPVDVEDYTMICQIPAMYSTGGL
jgi:hypothetical protein